MRPTLDDIEGRLRKQEALGFVLTRAVNDLLRKVESLQKENEALLAIVSEIHA